MKTISEYHIIKSFDENTHKIHHIIKNETGEVIYEMSYKALHKEISPLSPINYLEESLDGKELYVVPNHNQKLQEIAFKLHLLNVCESSYEKKNQDLSHIRKLIKYLKSLFTLS